MLLPALLLLCVQTSELKTATTHPIQYYVSLPKGWKKGKSWPVVLGIESAEREFKPYFRKFVQARADRPFIVVVPLVVTNGGPRYKEGPGYSYSESVWRQIDSDPWKFDDSGLQALIRDVHDLYNGESAAFLTGFEAGGHTLFSFVFAHPQLVKAAAPVSPNYAARNVSWGAASARPPFRCFSGANDELWSRFSGQWAKAKAAAQGHGYSSFSEQIVPDRGHEPMADKVLAWFSGRL
jgi:dienelactone hydrolase